MDEKKPKSNSMAAGTSSSQGNEPRKYSLPIDQAVKEEVSKRNEENKQEKKKDYKAQISSFLKEEFSPPTSLQGTLIKEQASDYTRSGPQTSDRELISGAGNSHRTSEAEEGKKNSKGPGITQEKAPSTRERLLDMPLKKPEIKKLYEEYANLKVLDDENEDQTDGNIENLQEDEINPKEKKMSLGATWKKDALVEKINKENLFEYLKGLEISLGEEKNDDRQRENPGSFEDSNDSPEIKDRKYDYNIMSIPENYSEENGTSRKNTMRQEWKQSAGKANASASASGSIVKKLEEEIAELSKKNEFLQSEIRELLVQHDEEMKLEKNQHKYLLIENTKLKNMNVELRNEVNFSRSRLALSRENEEESFFRESADERGFWKGKVLSTVKSKRFSVNNQSRTEMSPNSNIKMHKELSPISLKYARGGLSSYQGDSGQINWEKKYDELMTHVDELKQENETCFRKFLDIRDENKHLKQMIKDAKLELEQLKLQQRKNSAKIMQNTSGPAAERLDLENESHFLFSQSQEFANITHKLCKIMCADHPRQLVQIAKKYEKCIKMIPKIESFIHEICKIVFPQERIRQEDMDMKRVIKVLYAWKQESIEREDHFKDFITRLKALLNLDEKYISDEEIIRELEYTLRGKVSVSLSMRDRLFENFCKYFDVKGEENPLIVLNEIFKQNSDLSYFCKKLRHLLDLKGNLSSEDYLKAAVGALEENLNVSRKAYDRRKH